MDDTTIGCVIVAAPNESLYECLINLIDNSADDIIVFTWDLEQESVARQLNIRVIKIEPISHVEIIRQRIQTELLTDWVFLIDPDEIVRKGGIQILKDQIKVANPDVVGLWIPCRTMFIESELANSFSGLWQMRLFMKDRVVYSGSIHQLPTPINGYFKYPEVDDYIITHKFVSDLKSRFERHLQWAKVEAQELDQRNFELQDQLELFDAALSELKYYLVDKDGLKDGTVGLINALMHAWKRIATLAMLWEIQGARNKEISGYNNLKEKIEKLNTIKISRLIKGE